jgi:hypothetical protein
LLAALCVTLLLAPLNQLAELLPALRLLPLPPPPCRPGRLLLLRGQGGSGDLDRLSLLLLLLLVVAPPATGTTCCR